MAKLKVFVSYRRDDSRHIAGRMADHLRWEREVTDVFFDTKSIKPGEPLPDRISKALDVATHTLIVIGPKWNGGGAEGGTAARIRSDDDFVRQEVAKALSLPGEVIPVLVDGAQMPKEGEIPQDLWPIRHINAYPINNNKEFADELRPLLKHIIGHEPRGGDTLGSLLLKGVGGAVGGLLAFFTFAAVVTYVFGLSAAQLFGFTDPESAEILWRALLPAFVLVGAAGLLLIKRRWRVDFREAT